MIPTQFSYRRASTLDEAIELLESSDGAGRILAGGHSLVPLLKLRLSEPGVLIDIARVPGLRGIREVDGQIEVGAMTTHHEVATSEVVRRAALVVAEAAAEVGDPQVRNRGTLVGSLAHADPAADMPAVMVAVDAELHIKGPGGWRIASAEGFFRDLFTVDLAPSEIIAAVRFRPVKAGAYAKLHQRASHYALVGVAAALEVSGRTIVSARLGVTGASTHATRMPEVEAALVGQPAEPATIASASALAGDSLEYVNVDIHASEEYRRAMTGVFTMRALETALSRR